MTTLVSRMHPLLESNVNMFSAGILVETLKQCGLEYAIISPGSRSAPLATAFALNKSIKTVTILDERSAAFFALGKTKSTHRPVVLLCTSGTAAANYFPAVIEARMSQVPLIVLSADRPPEFRECHSGQTIDQVKIFGNYPNFYQELALPEAKLDYFYYLREVSKYAYERALFHSKGPVHLNIPYKDPLYPEEDANFKAFIKALDLDSFFQSIKNSHSIHYNEESIINKLKTIDKGLIVVGTVNPEDSEAFCQDLQKISEALAWPILAEGLSPARNFGLPVISAYDTILRNLALAAQLRPEAVLQVGSLPTSKVLRAFLQENQAQTYILETSSDNKNPLHVPAQYIRADSASFAQSFTFCKKNSDYLSSWQQLEQSAVEQIRSALTANEALFEGKIAYELSLHLPEKTNIFVASSMPARDVEYFWQKNNKNYKIYCNRGANGIDGTLSSAMGVAHDSTPTVLLTGDLSLLHDTNAWLNVAQFRGSLTIFLINNHGGRIFENLPISQYNSVFEAHFATPQTVNFKNLAEAYDIEYINPHTWSKIRHLMVNLPENGVRLVEINTNSTEDVPYRKHLFQSISNNLTL